MSIIYKNIIFLSFCILTNFIFGDNSEGQEYDKEKIKNRSASIWRHEINYPPLTTKSGLRSQVFFLILYDDGTYEQQVFIIPEDKDAYKGIKYYQLSGKWSSNNKEISLDEYGKTQKISNNDFYSKFENIDNLIVKK